MTLPASRYVLVTGTDTDVGKTIVTAALAVALQATGRTVTVVKPVQTGVLPGEPGDIDTIRHLAGPVEVYELARLRLPLAPESAARADNAPLPTVAEHVERIRSFTTDYVLIEGAGGLLVRLDLAGGTARDLASNLGADVVLVARETLGTLNHVELTIAALGASGLSAQLVIGMCTTTPGVAELANRTDLPRLTDSPVVAAIPAGAGKLHPRRFQAMAPRWFDSLLNS